ncbi:hypothetical protein CEXT_526181 [Caerostris extrusa]|uniref:Uncharacterized protein n=1 Tax=Caerostris extrusa TaxID=172846 RepID=A0AAV4PGA1_CAEEX|nr:hypothetical protein CEXT_526181 [Caerostris extrusa]
MRREDNSSPKICHLQQTQSLTRVPVYHAKNINSPVESIPNPLCSPHVEQQDPILDYARRCSGHFTHLLHKGRKRICNLGLKSLSVPHLIRIVIWKGFAMERGEGFSLFGFTALQFAEKPIW